MTTVTDRKKQTGKAGKDAAQAIHWFQNLTPQQQESIARHWQQAMDAPGEFGDDFYQHVFSAGPEVVALFPGDMSEQKRLLTATMSKAIGLIHNPDVLVLMLQASGVRHAHYGVQVAQFAIIGEAMLTTVANRCGADFETADRALWEDFYQAMAALMIQGLEGASQN